MREGSAVSESASTCARVEESNQKTNVPDWFRDALGAGTGEGLIDVDDCPISFRWWGDNSLPAVLLVHGDGAHSHWWDHIAPHLIASRCVVALDLSGHGDSGRRAQYSLRTWGQEIELLAEMFSPAGRPVVAAHSMGGHAAIHTAISMGDRLDGLVLLEAAARESRPQASTTRSRAFGQGKVYPTEEAALQRFRPWPNSPGALPYVIRHIARTSLHEVPGGWSWKFDPAIAVRVDDISLDDLDTITCPVALIGAEHGYLTADVAERMRARLGENSTFEEVLGAHHHIMLDRPVALIESLRAILTGWVPSRS